MNITDILDRFSVPYKRHGEDHHVSASFLGVQCPYCSPDSGKFHLGFSLSAPFCTCWTCGHLPLVKTLCELTGERYAVMAELTGTLDTQRVEAKPRGKLVLPSGVGPLQKIHRDYLRSRGFDPDTLARVWGVQGIGLHSRLAWRLFIPIIRQGKMVSWTTRAVTDEVKVRYISARPEEEAVNHREALFGEDFVRHCVIIVEGPLDAMKIGPGAVATFGVNYSEEQVARMIRYPRRVVMFDNEEQAQVRARRLAERLSPHPGETFVVKIKKKDAASLTDGEITEIRDRFI